jgi:hypothetical protein
MLVRQEKTGACVGVGQVEQFHSTNKALRLILATLGFVF